MGWTYFQAEKGKRSIDIMRDEYRSLKWYDAQQIRDVIYAAVSFKETPNEITALVVLTHRRNGQFGYKPMDESMGPCESECPARILDRLTNPPNDWARQWRERCRAKIREKVHRELQSARRGFECTGTFDGFTCGTDADSGL